MAATIQFPTIVPFEKHSDRPFWSVIIPTFNGSRFLAETLSSVLSQALPPGEMQIEVIDDGSGDETERIVNEVGKGRIAFHRNDRRLGLVGNWNSCIERAAGHWVHILHQDDVILTDFYTTLKKTIVEHSEAGAAFCRHSFIDPYGHVLSVADLERETAGILENWLEKIAVVQLIQFPSMVVKRSVYEAVGGFCAEAHFAADWEMWKRIARHFPVCYVPEMLACYRQHSASESSQLEKEGRNFADIRHSIEISKSYLPAPSAQQLSLLALEHYALFALNTADHSFKNGHVRVGLMQLREAFRTRRSFKVFWRLLQILSSVIKPTAGHKRSLSG